MYTLLYYDLPATKGMTTMQEKNKAINMVSSRICPMTTKIT